MSQIKDAIRTVPWWAWAAGGAWVILGGIAFSAMAYRAGQAVGLVRLVRVSGGLLPAPVAEAWRAMVEAARRDGVTLTLSSGFRTMEEQLKLWLRAQLPGATFVAAKPGHSNHQTGTAVDINVGGNNPSSPEYLWLARNAERFGFKNTGKDFSKPEFWHFDYQRPVTL